MANVLDDPIFNILFGIVLILYGAILTRKLNKDNWMAYLVIIGQGITFSGIQMRILKLLNFTGPSAIIYLVISFGLMMYFLFRMNRSRKTN